MRELGPGSPEFHRRAGQEAAEVAPAFLLAVGPQAHAYLDGASVAGLPVAAMAHVLTPEEAVPVLRKVLQSGDILLVKGSRAIEMERLVEALRAAMESASGIGAPASRA
jgi:UDP-N-acetylmuramoyl-tripeptide--D-alanyl-D-alanine ligase